MTKSSKEVVFEKFPLIIEAPDCTDTVLEEVELEDNSRVQKKVVTAESLGLILKKIEIRYCDYKISNQPKKMFEGETQALSTKGVSFQSNHFFEKGTLLRVWVQIPNFWSMKSKLVEYGHTDAPEYFQMLARCVQIEETGKRNIKYNLLAETVNLDPADEKLLAEFLFATPVKAKKSGLTKKSTL